MCDIVEDGPCCDVFSFNFNKVVVDSMEQKGQRLEENQ